MASLTYSRQGAALCKAYGTDDVAEAIKREIAEREEADVRGFTTEEILQDKIDEERRMTRVRTCQWPDCNVDISDRDPSAKYCQEHSKNKYTQALSRRKADAMSEERKCEWPGCDVDISDAHPLAKFCDEHKDEKKKQKAREYQKRAYAKKRVGQAPVEPIKGFNPVERPEVKEPHITTVIDPRQEIPVTPVPGNDKVTVSDLEDVMTDFTNDDEDQYPMAAMVWGYLRGRGDAA